jgi:hypothetical protein
MAILTQFKKVEEVLKVEAFIEIVLSDIINVRFRVLSIVPRPPTPSKSVSNSFYSNTTITANLVWEKQLEGEEDQSIKLDFDNEAEYQAFKSGLLFGQTSQSIPFKTEDERNAYMKAASMTANDHRLPKLVKSNSPVSSPLLPAGRKPIDKLEYNEEPKSLHQIDQPHILVQWVDNNNRSKWVLYSCQKKSVIKSLLSIMSDKHRMNNNNNSDEDRYVIDYVGNETQRYSNMVSNIVAINLV